MYLLEVANQIRGGVKVALEDANWLSRRGHQVTVVSRSAVGRERRSKEERARAPLPRLRRQQPRERSRAHEVSHAIDHEVHKPGQKRALMLDSKHVDARANLGALPAA